MKDNSYDFCDYINCSLIETDTTGDALYLLLLTLKNSISWYICAVFWDFIEIKLIHYLLNFFFYILMNHACQQNTGIVIFKKIVLHLRIGVHQADYPVFQNSDVLWHSLKMNILNK